MEVRDQGVARILYAVLDICAHGRFGKFRPVGKADHLVVVEAGIEQVDATEEGFSAVFVDVAVASGPL